MSKLKSLTIAALRGATNQVQMDFKKDSNLSVIYGENGSGKSSIVDAFDVICNNNSGSLV